MDKPSCFPGGATNDRDNKLFADFGMLDPTRYAILFNDFLKPTDFDTDDWTITTTEAGSGSATEAISDTGLGELVITNDDADNDVDGLQLSKETFAFVAGKKAWYEAKVKVNDATQSDLTMGLIITDTSPNTNTDGIYFHSDDGDTDLHFHVNKDSTDTDSGVIANLVDDTYMKMGFYYNGSDAVEVFIGRVKVATLVTDNLPDDEALTVTFWHANGEAVAKILTIDYFLVIQER